MLQIRELTKAYPSPDRARSFHHAGKAALDRVTLSMPSGGILCLLGTNGAGKTTLLKILAGLIEPDSGAVELAGRDIIRAPEEARRLTGFSPGEERSFYGRLTGLENLRFFAGLRGLSEPAFRRKLENLEGPLGLAEVLPIAYQKTSAGMKQRLSLARALLHDPPVLLLDEPTKSLDPSGMERVQSFVRRRMASGPDQLVLWSTHRVEEAWEVAGWIAVLDSARLVATGTPQDLLRRTGAHNPREAYRALMPPDPKTT